MQRQTKATLYALAAVLLWSTVASAFKLCLRVMDPMQLLLYASLSSLLTLLLVLVLQNKLHLYRDAVRTKWKQSALMGLLNPFLYYVILFKAYDLLPAQEAQPLNYTWAVTLALLSIPMLGQRIRLKDFLALLVSYAGVVVIATHGDILGFEFSNALGVALALASTIIWALYWILSTRDTRDPVAGLAANFFYGSIYILIATALVSDVRVTDKMALAGAAYVGVFEMGLTFVLWLCALRLSETTARVGNLIFLSPFVSLVLIHFLVGEDILPSTVLGLVFIVAGIALQQSGNKPQAT